MTKRLIYRWNGHCWHLTPMMTLRPGDLFVIDDIASVCEARSEPVYLRDLETWSIQAAVGPEETMLAETES